MRGPFNLSRRSFAVLSASAAAASVLGWRAEAAGGPVVVELFTSQGCSSCPPADAFLAELNRRPGVIALSLHVDYWDYLGWRDTLGSPDCAQRQWDYARRRGDGQVYTPQAIINGQAEMVGSDQTGMLDSIAREMADERRHLVLVSLASRPRELVIEVAAAPGERPRTDATVWVMAVTPRVTIDIRRGENAGRTISYTNVVRKIIPAGVWHGEELDLSLPKASILSHGSACAAVLQVDGTGPILGAAWISADGA